MIGATPIFNIDATGYHPVSEDNPEYAMEGGMQDRMGKPIQTLDAYLRGEAPFVTVAMDPSVPYGTVLRSPKFPGVPFVVADTGSAFKGKGLSRIDIARDTSDGANSDENNGKIPFQITNTPAPLKEGLFAATEHEPDVSNSPATEAMNATPPEQRPQVAAAFHNPLADHILQQALQSSIAETSYQLGNYAQGNGLNTGDPQSALQEISRYLSTTTTNSDG